jgi:hypothetical protein
VNLVDVLSIHVRILNNEPVEVILRRQVGRRENNGGDELNHSVIYV